MVMHNGEQREGSMEGNGRAREVQTTLSEAGVRTMQLAGSTPAKPAALRYGAAAGFCSLTSLKVVRASIGNTAANGVPSSRAAYAPYMHT